MIPTVINFLSTVNLIKLILVGVLIYLSLAGSSYAFFLGTLSTNQEVLLQLNTVN